MKNIQLAWLNGIAFLSIVLVAGCGDSEDSSSGPQNGYTPGGEYSADYDVKNSGAAQSGPRTYSAFGTYVSLPAWSDWCPLAVDEDACTARLHSAVMKPRKESRPIVRAHAWHLWAAAWAAVKSPPFRNDAKLQKTNMYGTGGCWSSFEDKTAACSGIYPIWLTWPNTGKPYPPAIAGGTALSSAPPASEPGETLIAINRRQGESAPGDDPDPTRTQTVNTAAPTYDLPPLVLSKQCNITTERAAHLLDKKLYRTILEACESAGAKDMFCLPKSEGKPPAICDGTAFVNQGDVMIATESLSMEGYENIQNNGLDEDGTRLHTLYKNKKNTVSELIGNEYISTKHMFWPVKGCKPGIPVGKPGCRIRYGALPPWIPKNFKAYSYATNADYMGYETWNEVIAIDTCPSCPAAGSATLELEYVSGNKIGPITTRNPDKYGVDKFVHVQISDEVLHQRFTPADRALLDQATIWAYGDSSHGFEAGDFLVVVAMHINTKELPSWTFQSVWWSPMRDKLSDCALNDYNHCFGQSTAYSATVATSAPKNARVIANPYSGLTVRQIADIDARVGSAWRDHYVLTDAYGINYEIDGTRVDVKNYFKNPPKWATTDPAGEPIQRLPISANVYIEPVIHPLGGNCQNCHRRAGYPGKPCGDDYSKGCGRSNYQTAQCADLLGDYGNPTIDLCMTAAWAWHDEDGNHCQENGGTLCDGANPYPVVSTDYIWIIADKHIPPAVRPHLGTSR